MTTDISALTKVDVRDLHDLDGGEVHEALVQISDVLVAVGGVLQLQACQQDILFSQET